MSPRLVASTLSLVTLTTVSAQEQALPTCLDLWDRNGDGAISAAEVIANGVGQFGQLDLDGDGLISQIEFVEFHLALLSATDRDADGKVNQDELSGLLQSRHQP